MGDWTCTAGRQAVAAGMASTTVIAVTVGLSVLSVVFSILACVVNTSPDIGSNWWPMFVVATWALAPFPVIILSRAQTAAAWGLTGPTSRQGGSSQRALASRPFSRV